MKPTMYQARIDSNGVVGLATITLERNAFKRSSTQGDGSPENVDAWSGEVHLRAPILDENLLGAQKMLASTLRALADKIESDQ